MKKYDMLNNEREFDSDFLSYFSEKIKELPGGIEYTINVNIPDVYYSGYYKTFTVKFYGKSAIAPFEFSISTYQIPFIEVLRYEIDECFEKMYEYFNIDRR